MEFLRYILSTYQRDILLRLKQIAVMTITFLLVYWWIMLNMNFDVGFLIAGAFIIFILGMVSLIFVSSKATNNENDNMTELAKKAQEILKKQGIDAEFDEEGTLVFEFRYLNYYLEHDKEDEDWLRITLPAIYSIEEDDDVMRIYKAANMASCNIKFVNLYVTEKSVHIIVECYVDYQINLENMLRRYISVCEAAYMEFRKQLNVIPEN